MTEITETDYIAWKRSTFGEEFDIWHDGLAVEVVTPLTGDTRSHAIRMLIFGLKQGDGHAATALASMGERAALPELRSALYSASGDTKVKIARAINDLAGEDDSSEMSKELISVLESPDLHWGVRLNAAMGLRDFKDEKSEEALLRAVEMDPDFLVRHHSVSSLLARWGKSTNTASSKAIFRLIGSVGEDDAIQDRAARGKAAVKLLNELKNEING
jgi:hypothetical protein